MKDKNPTKSLRFIAISGTTDVTENMYLYEYGNDIVVVDCGVGFPEEASFGVDLAIPDFSYIRKNKNKIRAVFITHGHEDHLGALPFLLQEINVPIYATRLVAGFIEDKFVDHGVKGYTLNVFDPEKDAINAGSFKVEAFRVSHSVPDGVGYCITTPEGRFFHVPDYKFDWTPVDQKPFDVLRAATLAKGGVVALASDALGATSDGYTKSELELERNIEVILGEAKSRVYFTTVSSNISRMQQAINASSSFGRKVAFIGRSVQRKAEIARRLGYLRFDKGTVVSPEEARKLPPEKVTYVISGSYGQSDSALTKVATGEHKFLKVSKEDVVIFSSDPAPPGSREAVDQLVDMLIEKGAEVHYYDTQEDLHVSGHGSQKEIEMLFALIEPKYLIPIGGTVRHMRAYSQLAQRMGWKANEVFELKQGGSVEFLKGSARPGENVPSKPVLVDGLGVGDVGRVVLGDRKTLAKEGIVVAVVRFDKKERKAIGRSEIISRGFVFAKKHQDFLDRSGDKLTGTLNRGKAQDAESIKKVTVDFLERFFLDETGRRPMILPVVVEI